MQKEYIERTAAIRLLRGNCIRKYPSTFSMGLVAGADEISQLPAADVVEVRHAKWTTRRTEMHDGEWYCTGCDYEPQAFENSNYCPHCGCKMDKEE